MHPKALTPLAAWLPSLRVLLLLAGLAVVESSRVAGAALWIAATATVVAGILVGAIIDRRRPRTVIAAKAELDDDAAPAHPAGVASRPSVRAATGARAVTEGGRPTRHVPQPSVVCAVDGSAESQAAVAVAAPLARRLGARLVVAHVVDGRAAPARADVKADRADPAVGGATDDVIRGAAQLISRTAADVAGDGVEYRVAAGFAADQLADIAEEEQAELLVVGSRGRGGVKRAFLGSVSSSVIGVARCPVVVVPPGVPNERAGAFV
jgi:nucleotide-binding universal stress UspA family protein